MARFEVGRASQTFLTSSLSDSTPQFSHDGQRVAFCSNRSGTSMEVWVAAADGSNAAQLTHGPGRWPCSPRWSQDGKHIAFDSLAADGHWHIWTIDADGGIRHPAHEKCRQSKHTVLVQRRNLDLLLLESGKERSRNLAHARFHGTQERVVGIEGSAGNLFAIESPDGKSVLSQPHGPDSALAVRRRLLLVTLSRSSLASQARHSRLALGASTMSRVDQALRLRCT